jgi:hypothetical protein
VHCGRIASPKLDKFFTIDEPIFDRLMKSTSTADLQAGDVSSLLFFLTHCNLLRSLPFADDIDLV